MAASLGARIKQARRMKAAKEGRDVTQAEVAKILGVTPVTISRYESDLQEPANAVIVQIAAALNVTPGWLAFGEGADVVPKAAPSPAASARARGQEALDIVDAVDAAVAQASTRAAGAPPAPAAASTPRRAGGRR